MNNLESFMQRLAEHLLSAFARKLPADLQPWGDAMLAEVAAVKGTVNPLIWAMGGSLFLSKTLFVRWFSGESTRGPEFREGQITAFQKLGFIAMAFFFAMLLSPMFRQAMGASLTAWTPLDRSSQSPDLQGVIREAERTGDASVLAAAAMHVRDFHYANDLAGKATRIDPQLNWVWYPLVQRSMGSLPQTDQDSYVKEKLAILKAWDPTNAIPWIVSANRIRMQRGGVFASAGAAVRTLNNPIELAALTKWQAEISKAFAAPHYDDYFDRRMAAERALETRLGNSTPFAVVNTMETFPFLQLQEAELFTSYKLAEGDKLMAQGELNEAVSAYEIPRVFARRLPHSRRQFVEKIYADKLLNKSEAKLAAAFTLMHHDDEARQLLAQIALRKSQAPDFSQSRKFWEIVYGPVTATGMAVSVASGFIVLSFALILIGFLYFFIRPVLFSKLHAIGVPRWLDRTLIAAAQYSPLLLLASSLSLYISYQPFGKVFNLFLNGDLPSSQTDSLRTFWQMRYVPNLVIEGLGGSDYLELWGWLAFTVLLLIPLAIVLWRFLPSRKASPVS
jgi:hypothetical protein